MNEKNLNIKETYSLILSNIEKKYNNVFLEDKLLKIENEKTFPEIKLLNKENNEEFRKDLINNIDEYSLYDLPLYYAKHDDKMKEKYNEFMIKSFSNNSYTINHTYYSNYISKKNDKYFVYEIKSDNSLINYLDKSIKEEELELLYDVKKEELSEDDFNNLLKKEIEQETLKYFENMGLKLFTKGNDFFGYYLNSNYNNNLDKSIYKYVFNKHEYYLIKEVNNIKKEIDLKELTSKEESLNYFIKLVQNKDEKIDIRIYNEVKYLKNIFINVLNNDINSESLLNIKEYINLAINDFDNFVKEHKGKIIDSFNDLLIENNTNKKIKQIDFNDILKINKDKKLTDNEFVNKAFDGHELNSDWYKLKCFIFENMFSNPLFFKDLKASSFEDIFQKNFTKRIGNKTYNIDFENQSISWSFINKEEDELYQKEKRELFKELKQQYMNENPDISKEELKEKLNPILSRDVSPNEILKNVGYDEKKYQESSLNNLKKIFETNIDLFQNNLNYSFKKFIEKNKIDSSGYLIHHLNTLKEREKILFNKNNHSVILNMLLDKYNVNDEDKIYINDIIYKNKIILNNSNYVDGLLNDFCNNNVKEAILEFVYTMEYKILSEINYLKNNQDFININNSFFDDFYLFKKLISVIQDFDNNQKFYQLENINDEEIFNKIIDENIEFKEPKNKFCINNEAQFEPLKLDFLDDSEKYENVFIENDKNNDLNSFFDNNKDDFNGFFDINNNDVNIDDLIEDKKEINKTEDFDLDLTF